MRKRLLISGTIVCLLAIVFILVTVQPNVFGATPFWANYSPTELPPQAKT